MPAAPSASHATFVEALAGGWRVSGIAVARSGEAATLTYTPAAQFVVSGINQDFRGENNYRRNVVGDVDGDTNSVTTYSSKASVVIPTDRSKPFGNAPRNSVRAVSFFQGDFVASKDLLLMGSTKLRSGVEAFNLFDRANFRAPNAKSQLCGVRDDQRDVGRAPVFLTNL